MQNQEYLEKVYGGLLGKCVGVRLGAPVEPLAWTYERIKNTWPDIRGYIRDYRTFAADDDINGPLFFIRALMDYPPPITAKEVGRTWLNYTREEIGFYWWGGYGRSTEHTAYLNLKAGLDAPLSGSIRVNGATVAEQIGGQIFIDSWGWVFPGDYVKAADSAGMAASVGHDGNGIYGARFIAACISLAFVENDILQIIERALKVIPADSGYCRVARAVVDFYHRHPGNWREAMEMLEADFGYDRYAGDCHIIPNAGVCVLALCYGEGDFARTVEIATMCGWDTDCNAGNVGAVLGVMRGPLAIPDRYRTPINDFHAASSISGALNIINIPVASRELAILGLRQRGAEVPEAWLPGAFSSELHLDFSLPGSTGGLRAGPANLVTVAGEKKPDGGNRTSVLLDLIPSGTTARVFYKPYYTREEFDDERYSPTFTPLVYPGQLFSISGTVERMNGERIALAPYVRDARSGTVIEGGCVHPEPGVPFSIQWKLPEIGSAIDEVGVLATNFDPQPYLGRLQIGSFSVTGKHRFDIRFADERHEFKGLSRCSAVGGGWRLEDGGLRVITDRSFHLYAGPYYTKDSTVCCDLVPEYGDSHLLLVRSRGAESAYYFGFHGADRVALIKRDHEVTVLSEAPFAWEPGKQYRLEVTVRGNILVCGIGGKELVSFTDTRCLPYGMAGAAKLAGGRTLFLGLSATEL